VLRDNLAQLYDMRDELQKTYRRQIDIVHSQYQGTHVVNVGKGKASSLDIAPLTVLNSGTLQPRKWQLTGNDCSTAAQAVAAQRPR